MEKPNENKYILYVYYLDSGNKENWETFTYESYSLVVYAMTQIREHGLTLNTKPGLTLNTKPELYSYDGLISIKRVIPNHRIIKIDIIEIK